MRIRLQRHDLRPTLLSLPLAILSAVALYYAMVVPLWYEPLVTNYPLVAIYLEKVGTPQWSYQLVALICGTAAVIWFLVALLAFVRTRVSLSLLRFGYALTVVVAFYVFWAVWMRHAHIAATQLEIIPVPATPAARFTLWTSQVWPIMLGLVVIAWLYILSWQRATLTVYTGVDPESPQLGDRILENIRTWGPDPRYRFSWTGTIMAIVMLCILYWISTLVGCVEPYRIPEGRGNPVVALVQVVKPQQKPKERFLLNPNSPIILTRPDLDVSKLLEEVQEATEVTYQASTNVHGGAMGAGGEGKGGWPDGVPGGRFRFIRLAHGAPNESEGMGEVASYHGGADLNFLNYLRSIVPFDVANRSEMHEVGLLSRYPEGMAPPFVFMHGDGRFSLSSRDREVLRDYVMSGGMIFASAGTGGYHGPFMATMQQVFPGHRWITIDNQHPVHMIPFNFPNGPPPFWRHDGRGRPMGMVHRGRLIVYYHPGDLVAAWKDRSISALPTRESEMAYQVGVNVCYYAITQYLNETRKQRRN